MKVRIKERKFSTNILEIRDEKEGKERWIPLLACLLPKKDGDKVIEQLFKTIEE